MRITSPVSDEGPQGVESSELEYLDVTPGTVTASKAAVVDANKDAGDFRNLDAVNIDAGASGAAGTVDVFPATAARGKVSIAAADSTGDTTTTITNASQAGARTYTIPDAGASASFAMTEGAQTINGVKTFGSIPVLPAGGATFGATTITETEVGVLDGVTAGTAAASKAVTLDADAKVDGLPLVKRSLTALSNAQLQALAATPVQVVAAPVAGKFIQVLGWRFRLIFGTVAIDDAAADGNLILKYAGGSTIDVMEADGLIDAAATTQGLSGNLTELIVAETGIDNTAVQISNDGAEYTVVGGGDATAEVEVFYRILDSNPA